MHPLRGVIFAIVVLVFISVALAAIAMVVSSINTVTRMLDIESLRLSGKAAADWRYLQRADEVLRTIASAAVLASVVGVLIVFFKHVSKR